MEVTGVQFSKPGMVGDFNWMIERPEYADALFIFNDNEEQFRAYQKDKTGGSGCAAGNGNASIRPYRCQNPPRAAGVPTGEEGQGYPKLTDEVQGVLDESFAVITDVLASGNYQQIIYSAANSNGDLGTGIFSVGDDVKRYIVTQLRAFGD